MKNIKELFYSEEGKIEIVECLNNNKDVCVKYDFWGDDNHRKMDVFIDVIENNRTEEYIYLNYPSWDDNGKENLTKHSLWSSGIQALEFMCGKTPISDYLYPEKTLLLTNKKKKKKQMKKIKFIVLLCLLTVGLTSCFENVQDTVKNPLVETTVSIQQLPKDTVVVSIQDRTLYVFDDENNLKYVTVGIEDESFPISIFFFLIFTVMVFILGLIIGND